jgi:hypothetical protein
MRKEREDERDTYYDLISTSLMLQITCVSSPSLLLHALDNSHQTRTRTWSITQAKLRVLRKRYNMYLLSVRCALAMLYPNPDSSTCTLLFVFVFFFFCFFWHDSGEFRLSSLSSFLFIFLSISFHFPSIHCEIPHLTGEHEFDSSVFPSFAVVRCCD